MRGLSGQDVIEDECGDDEAKQNSNNTIADVRVLIDRYRSAGLTSIAKDSIRAAGTKCSQRDSTAATSLANLLV